MDSGWRPGWLDMLRLVLTPTGTELARFTADNPGPERDALYSALRLMCREPRRTVRRGDGVLMATSVLAVTHQPIDAFGSGRGKMRRVA